MPLAKPLPPAAYLREALRLDPENGQLFWLTRPRHHFTKDAFWKAWNTLYSGRRADRLCRDGYCRVFMSVARRMRGIPAHRIVWVLVHGTDFQNEPDHIDRNPANNRPENLRDVTRSENQMNRRSWHRRSSHRGGVCAVGTRFRARVMLSGVYVHLGYFETQADAIAAVARAVA